MHLRVVALPPTTNNPSHTAYHATCECRTWRKRAEYVSQRAWSAPSRRPPHHLTPCPITPPPPVIPHHLSLYSTVHGGSAPTTCSAASLPRQRATRRSTSSCAPPPLHRLSSHATCHGTVLYMARSRRIPLPPQLCSFPARDAIPRAPLPHSAPFTVGVAVRDMGRICMELRSSASVRCGWKSAQYCTRTRSSRGCSTVLPTTSHNISSIPSSCPALLATR
jgi:hypothetical protein